MTLDAHALIAIVCQQPGWQGLVAQVMGADHPRVPATALAEAGMLLTARQGVIATLALDDVVRTLGLTVVPFTEHDWSRAVFEYQRRRESPEAGPARLGDCLSAVVAARTGSRLVVLPPARQAPGDEDGAEARGTAETASTSTRSCRSPSSTDDKARSGRRRRRTRATRRSPRR